MDDLAAAVGGERDLERAVAGGGPIIAGPWLSEVGYEVLYWVPFLRWVDGGVPDPAGADRGYVSRRHGELVRGIARRLRRGLRLRHSRRACARAAAGQLKQREVSDLDRRLIDSASRALGMSRMHHVLHPSLHVSLVRAVLVGPRNAGVRGTPHPLTHASSRRLWSGR